MVDVGIVGVGFVGSSTAMVMCRAGHHVFAYDTDAARVQGLVEGNREPPGHPLVLDEIANFSATGQFRALPSLAEVVARVAVLFVCVPTPISTAGGRHDLSSVNECLELFSAVCATDETYRVIAIRSTLTPDQVSPLWGRVLATSGRTVDQIGMVVNPEFLRERFAWEDSLNPTFILIGETSSFAGDLVHECYGQLGSIERTTIAEAAMVKVASNAFHALKVDFANEVSALSERLGMDPERVMDTFLKDTRLNLSELYLRPGFSFGGTCLPKDVVALQTMAKDMSFEAPLLQSLVESNLENVHRVYGRLECEPNDTVVIFGHRLPRAARIDDQPFLMLLRMIADECREVLIFADDMSSGIRDALSQAIPTLGWPHQVSDLPAHPDIIIVAEDSPGHLEAAQHLTARKLMMHLSKVRTFRSGQTGLPLQEGELGESSSRPPGSTTVRHREA